MVEIIRESVSRTKEIMARKVPRGCSAHGSDLPPYDFAVQGTVYGNLLHSYLNKFLYSNQDL